MIRAALLAILLLAGATYAHSQEPPLLGQPAIVELLPPVEADVPSPAETAPSPSDQPASEEKLVVEDHGWGGYLAPAAWDAWDGNIELGLNGTEGNTQTFNVRLGATAKHKTEWLVKTVQITSIQKNANGVTTANTALLDGRLDWPIPSSPWNYFIHGLVEYDEFKAFDARISADTGFGYEFIQNDRTTLIGRAGIAASQEIGGVDTTVHPELLFGGEYKHKFNDTHSLSFKTDYYPSVDDFGDFRLNSQASWEIALSSAWGLSLKMSIIDRYDSTPQGAKPNDLDYSWLLLWSF